MRLSIFRYQYLYLLLVCICMYGRVKIFEVSETESFTQASQAFLHWALSYPHPTPFLPFALRGLLELPRVALNSLSSPDRDWTWDSHTLTPGLAVKKVSIFNCCYSLVCFSWKFLLNHALYSQDLQKKWRVKECIVRAKVSFVLWCYFTVAIQIVVQPDLTCQCV